MKNHKTLSVFIFAALCLAATTPLFADGTTIQSTGMFEGIVDLEIDPTLKPFADAYVNTLFDDDFNEHIKSWHPKLQACVTPETESYFRARVDKFSSRLAADNVAREYRIAQFVQLPANYTDQYQDYFESEGLYMPVEPTHMIVIDTGKEGSYFDEATSMYTGYPSMTLMVSLTKGPDGRYWANNVPCKK